jgi:hypothetical protein
MSDKHAPHDEFVGRLEAKIGREAHRRNSLAPSSGWLPRLHLKAAVGVAVLIVVSMAIGGAVVAAAYQAQDDSRRDALRSELQASVDLAVGRLRLVTEQLRSAEQRMAIGVGSEEAVFEARAKVAEADAQVKAIRLQLDEVLITAREPLSQVSSPLVSGRDFVTERWKIELSVPVSALEFEKLKLRTAEHRVAVGMADARDLEVSRARIVEVEAGIEAFHKKLDIRQQFLKGEFDAGMADLRMIESETEQRRKALVPKIELAKKAVVSLDAKVQVGMAPGVERTEAQVRVMELELELSKLDIDLAVVRKQIAHRRGR